MKKTLLIIVASFLFGGFFASCTANRGFVSSLTRADIRQMQQFKPFNQVGIIEKGNNNLAFVSTAMRESDPLEESTYRKQMEDLMKKYKK